MLWRLSARELKRQCDKSRHRCRPSCKFDRTVSEMRPCCFGSADTRGTRQRSRCPGLSCCKTFSMYSSSNSEVVSVDDSDYIQSDRSFVSDSDSCSTGRSVEILLLQNTTDMGSGTSSITRNIPTVQAREAVVTTADTTMTVMSIRISK